MEFLDAVWERSIDDSSPAQSAPVTGGSLEHDLARRLLASELVASGAPLDSIGACEGALRRVRERLARWLGPDGSDAVFARALDRARVAHPALADVRVSALADWSISASIAAKYMHDPAAVTEALLVLMAGVLALLTQLIGGDLVDRLLHELSPDDTRGLKPPRARSPDRRVSQSE